MKYIAIYLMAVIAMAASAQPASGPATWTKTPALYAACKSISAERPKNSPVSPTEMNNALVCSAYLAGVYGGIAAEHSMPTEKAKRTERKPDESQLCLTEPGPSGRELVQLFVKVLDENPELMQLAPNDVAYLSLMDRYKCPR